MNPKNGKFRVILVYLSFLPIALGAMWLIGGRPFFCKVTVRTNQKATEMRDRLDELAKTLPWIDRDSQVSLMDLGRDVLATNTSNKKSSEQTTVQNVRFDIVLEDQLQDQGNFFCVDPSIIGTESGFSEAGIVTREWVGRREQGSQTILVFKECDQQGRSRLVQINQEGLEFTPAPTSSVGNEIQSDVSYSFEIQHQGLKRIYGRFLERTCEENHRKRLLWICDQLKEDSK